MPPKIKEIIQETINFFKTNPHLGPSILLFLLGVLFLLTNHLSAISGALFGAGASLLGAWISDFNTKQKELSSKTKRENDAILYFTPELTRTISRVINIHNRAIVNYSSNARNYHKKILERSTSHPSALEPEKLGDKREDFIPYLPLLYPNAPQFQDLSGNKTLSLIMYYDSLFALQSFVQDWWERDGQLPSNIFNSIIHQSETSLKMALNCLKELDIEQSDELNTNENSLTFKINESISQASNTREIIYKEFEKTSAQTKSKT